MLTVSIHEAKTRLSALIRAIENSGERILIERHGVPVAELVPLRHGDRTALHKELKDVVIRYDPTQPTGEEWEDV